MVIHIALSVGCIVATAGAPDSPASRLAPWGDVLRENGFVGVVDVAVGKDSVFHYASGVEVSGKQAGDGSVFWIGSVSKQFPAAAVLRLVDAGKINLGAPVTRYLELSEGAMSLEGTRCTVLQILSHTCGLPEGSNNCPSLDLHLPKNAKGFLGCVADLTLEFAPGTNYLYANVGADLAGVLAAAVSEKPYGDFLREAFFDPVGMTATGTAELASRPELSSRLVQGELSGFSGAVGSDTWLWLDPAGPGRRGPSGNIYSTASDLHRWNRALHGGKLLSEKSYHRMVTPVRDNYGLGIAVKEYAGGTKAYWHNGALVPMNWSAHLAFVPELDLSVAVLTPRNTEVSRMDDVGFGIVRGLLEKEAPALIPLKAEAYALDLVFFTLPLLVYLCLVGVCVLVLRGPRKSLSSWASSLTVACGVPLALVQSLDFYHQHSVVMFIIALVPAVALLLRRARWLPTWHEALIDPKERRGTLLLAGVVLFLAWILKGDARLWLALMVGLTAATAAILVWTNDGGAETVNLDEI